MAAARRLIAARPQPAAKTLAPALAAQQETVQAVQAARGAMAVGWQSAKTMRLFLDDFDAVSDYKGGDMQPADYRRLRTPLRSALLAARASAQAADAAAGFVNSAKADLILARLDMFDPLATPARRASFATLLQHRFAVSPSDVRQSGARGLDAGQIAIASIVAAETGRQLSAVTAQMRERDISPTAFAASAGIRSETVQLELGLVWTGYSDGSL